MLKKRLEKHINAFLQSYLDDNEEFKELGDKLNIPTEQMTPEGKNPLSIFEFPLQTWEEFCVIKLLADLANRYSKNDNDQSGLGNDNELEQGLEYLNTRAREINEMTNSLSLINNDTAPA